MSKTIDHIEGCTPAAQCVELPFDPRLSGRPGFLHGGAIAGFLAQVCDQAIAGQNVSFRSISSSVQFLRGAREATLQAQAQILHQGSASVTVRARAWQDSVEKPVALIVRKYRRVRSGPLS